MFQNQYPKTQDQIFWTETLRKLAKLSKPKCHTLPIGSAMGLVAGANGEFERVPTRTELTHLHWLLRPWLYNNQWSQVLTESLREVAASFTGGRLPRGKSGWNLKWASSSGKYFFICSFLFLLSSSSGGILPFTQVLWKFWGEKLERIKEVKDYSDIMQ